MAYAPDEVNNWGAPVVRGFCWKGEAHVPGAWWYGPADDFVELTRLGVFGQPLPRWLMEERLARYQGFQLPAPNPPRGSYGNGWETVFALQYHVFT